MIYFDTIDSTNTYAKNHFQELADGELIAAGEQTAGRGRLNRKWASSPGNIFASYVLKGIQTPFLGVIACSLATLDLIRTLCPEYTFYIKWPNDIFYCRSKISGILAEYVHSSSSSGLIVGVGINISMSEEELSHVGQPAVSLFSLTGRTTDVMTTLNQFERNLSARAEQLRRAPEELFNLWKLENALLGKTVEFDMMDGRRLSGVFKDIAGDGTAIMMLQDGSRMQFNCGDVRLHPEEDSFSCKH